MRQICSMAISKRSPPQLITYIIKLLDCIQTSNTLLISLSNMHHLVCAAKNIPCCWKSKSELQRSYNALGTLPPSCPPFKRLRITYWRWQNQLHCAELRRQMLVVILLRRPEYSHCNIRKNKLPPSCTSDLFTSISRGIELWIINRIMH